MVVNIVLNRYHLKSNSTTRSRECLFIQSVSWQQKKVTVTLFDILERLVSLQTGRLYRHPQLKGLPAIWVQIIYYLTRCNGYSNTPAATTEYLDLTKGTVSQSLNKLESEGWLTKENDGRDKRIVHLV